MCRVTFVALEKYSIGLVIFEQKKSRTRENWGLSSRVIGVILVEYSVLYMFGSIVLMWFIIGYPIFG